MDDEPNLLLSLEGFLKTEGIGCLTAPDGRSAQAILQDRTVDAVVLDLRMPGMDGMTLLLWIKESGPDVPVIMASAHGDVGDAVEAMKLGAYDYLVKPFDPDELVLRLRKAVRERTLQKGAEADRRSSEERVELIGRSPAILEAVRLIEKAAVSPATMLLTGESGTGKEVAARLAHQASRRYRPLHSRQSGGDPGDSRGKRTLRAREGGVHGCRLPQAGILRVGSGGHAFPGRDRGTAPASPGQAAAGTAGTKDSAARRRPGHPRGLADHRGHQPGSGGPRSGRTVPGRPVLPDKRDPDRPAPAPGSRRGHRAAGGVLPEETRLGHGPAC
ncbi:MAG: response regulator [Desulfomicrobium escambiense]|nr:response regulator [Desulfomicrobium escambiense]